MEQQSRKRKRVEYDSEDRNNVSFSVFTSQPSTVGPALASFPAVEPPSATLFQCFSRTGAQEPDFATAQTLIGADTENVEFWSINKDKITENMDYSCHYMVGVYDKSSNKVILRQAPLYVVRPDVKALKDVAIAATSAGHGWAIARNALGEAFGTKKALAAIRAAERQKVDASAMQDVQSVLQDTIAANTLTLPNEEDVKAEAGSNRAVPPINLNASRPDEVYPLDSLIPSAELAAVSVRKIVEATTEESRIALLPYSRSEWINTHLNRLTIKKPGKSEKQQIRLLYYISCMLVFKRVAVRVHSSDALREKMPNIPEFILDGLSERFMEPMRESGKIQVTPQMETKLMTHLLALCLRMDNYTTDIKILASDLGMAPTTLQNYFKSLGCVCEKAKGDASGNKFAILRLPLTFPKQRKMKV